MNKIERIDRVLQGGAVDYPPLSLWYHFGTQHGDGAAFAKTALAYFNHYDFDFLKVMNDYFYPSPGGLEAVCSAADLKRLDRFDVEYSAWREQFKALEIIAEALHGRAYFIDTVFDAWQSLNRNLAAETLKALMEQEPEALLQALERINANLIDYARRSMARGAAGIFLSIPAGSEILSREQFLTFVKPFARELLEATADKGRMNTLHVHGKDLFFEDVLDLPAPVFNWWDRGPGGPSLQWVLQRIPGCVMGGIDQTLVARRTRTFLRNHVREGLQLGGERRFFLANGCSIDTWTYPGAIEAIVETARQGKKS
ncbi:MAG: uroporphyrinogen decarboxylase family protein [Desulfosarcinaceae bacterium]